jgi:hypothetical protein
MVSIECILHGNLEDYLPEGQQSNQARLEFESTPTVDEILAHFKIDRDYLQFVLADGCYIELQNWSKPSEGRLFQFWPRISGG